MDIANKNYLMGLWDNHGIHHFDHNIQFGYDVDFLPTLFLYLNSLVHFGFDHLIQMSVVHSS